jgi:hypothetical protein
MLVAVCLPLVACRGPEAVVPVGASGPAAAPPNAGTASAAAEVEAARVLRAVDAELDRLVVSQASVAADVASLLAGTLKEMRRHAETDPPVRLATSPVPP